MPPNSEITRPRPCSNPGFQVEYPSLRDVPEKNAELWLKGKRKDDAVGNLWRVHDKLYDLSKFMDRHPGGRFWLEQTRGTDITEAFEASHLNPAVVKMLPKFYVKDASGPRNSPYTFHEDGFYKTLKKKVWPIISRVGSGPTLRMKVQQDCTVLVFLALMVAAAHFRSYLFAVAAGVVLNMVMSMAHNFFHQADNFRMYYFDLSSLTSSDWRVTHALSHHLYTNTFYDYEVSVLEPFLYFLPTSTKPWAIQYITPISCHLVMLVGFLIELVKKIVTVTLGRRKFQWTFLFPVAEVLLFLVVSGEWRAGIGLYLTMMCVASFTFTYVGLTAAHHHPDIYHTPDAFRKHPDWGLCQMDAVRDRMEITGSLFLVTISFGDHTLHHLLPTIDHSKLPLLYPVFLDHCREHNINFSFVRQADLCLGMYRQLASSSPNLEHPSYKLHEGKVLLPPSVVKEVEKQKKTTKRS